MDKIEEYLKKITKKAGDTQAYYTYVIDHRSTLDKPLYNATVVWTKQGLTPLQISMNTKKGLLDELKKYYRTQKLDDLMIRFHENQIRASEGVIKHHQNMILAYKNPKEKKK